MRGTPFELTNASGAPVRGDVYLPDGSNRSPVVVVCHGFKGFKNWGFFPELGARLAGSGFVAVTFNFSGSGIGPDLQNFTELDRFARDTTSKQVDDLRCVMDALDSRRIGADRADLERIAVLGHSRGAAVALIGAHEDARIRAVVAWAGVSTFWRYSDAEIETWKQRGYVEALNTRTQQLMRMDYSMVEDLEAHRARFDVERVTRALTIALLFVHGDNDESVPVREAHVLHDAAAGGRLHVVHGTGHTFGAVHPWQGSTPALDEAIETTDAWLHEHWAGAQESDT